MRDRLMIFIPTYNCEKQLPRVLEKIDLNVQRFVEEIVIIDNRSNDATVTAAVRSAQTLGVKVSVLRNMENYSLGGSIKRAFLYAMEQGYDYVITLHGDDQADIRELSPMLESGDYRRSDIVIGARFHPDSRLEGYSFVRRAGNRMLNFVCALIHRRRIDDLIAGINCFKVDFFRSQFFLRFPDNLTFDAHFLLYALSRKAQVKYIPITWREEDQASNAKVMRQAFIILRLFAGVILFRDRVFERNQSGRAPGFRYESELLYQSGLQSRRDWQK
jgi:glycosyltransferase involved in cell wall biosynthesis